MNQVHATNHFQAFTRPLAVSAVLLFTGFWYVPGLNSGFILDDLSNLSRLELIKSTQEWDELWRFVLEGYAGSLGRPLSLLSFALQAEAWPNAYAFKQVNLLIHLLNGLLIFALLQQLLHLYGLAQRTAFWLSWLTCALWLLHPMQVSTVLYVVQRMAQLSAFFTLAGLLLYVWGRTAHAQGKNLLAFLLMSLGIGLGGVLATLSKENGILLPLYVLALEFSLLQQVPRPTWWLRWASLFCFAPLGLLLLWFATHPQMFTDGYSLRDFSLSERLLTESRILFEYLRTLFLPNAAQLNLFHDDYLISRGLFEPLTTLFAVLGLLVVALSAWIGRIKYPVFALAVFWFATGHALESTALPLMLYFEHRNYLAILGPLLGVLYGLYWLVKQVIGYKVYSLAGLAMLWCALLLTLSYTQIGLWQQPLNQAIYWAEQKPGSRFAQSYAAALLLQAQQPQKALAYYQQMQAAYPDDTGHYALRLTASCYYPQLMPDLARVQQHFLAGGRSDSSTSQGIDALVRQILKNQCPAISSQQALQLIQALQANPKIATLDKAIFYVLAAQLQAAQGDYAQAIVSIEQGLELQPQMPDHALAQMLKLAWLMQTEQYQKALDFIQSLQQELSHSSLQAYAEHLHKLQQMAQAQLTKSPGTH